MAPGIFMLTGLRYKWVGMLLLVIVPVVGHAQFGKFVNPGPLSNPHKSLEGLKNCTQCHSASQGLPDAKCLGCHTDIKQRLDARQGYHTHQSGTCASCHTEHKGRSFDVTGLSRIKFDHTDTGWPLTGAHRDQDCTDCHKKKRKGTNRQTYLGNDARCKSCHTNIHKSKKKTFSTCQNCHGTRDWKPRSKLNFSHNRQTKFALEGAHAKVACFSCHKNKTWAPLAHAQCSNCHNDPHKGSFGSACSDCHSTKVGWSGSALQVPTAKGPRNQTGVLKTSFDHNRTRFPLRGKHRAVSCKSCHRSKIGKMPTSKFADCKGCHLSPHKGQFQKIWKKKTCNSCHSTLGYKNLNKFKHNTAARYQLLGQHTKVACQSCHKNGRYRWLAGTPDCDVCHGDPHNGKFKPQKCASCHNFNGFSRKNFDHNRTRFPLVGKHKAVTCSDCHGNKSYNGLSTACNSCHNDSHKGQLGSECERCHSPTGFNNVDFDHNRQARFRLDGKHLENSCNQCHWGGKYKFEQLKCATCHVDVHNGSHGQECDRCHTTAGFTMKEGFHEFGQYTLKGVHNQLECSTCHNPNEPVRPRPMQCSSCHQDPHMGSLSNSCYECHTQVSWHPTHFQHNQTGFDLDGAHRFLDCSSCHLNRVFGGIPTECVFCHFKDFDAAAPQHINAPTTCETCHFTFGFRPTK